MKTLECKEIIHGLPPFTSKEESWALDLELSGLREEQLHRPAGHMVSFAGTCDGETVYIIQDEDDVKGFLYRIAESDWVFHNSVFDLGHLRRWAEIGERKNMRDTMLIERLMFSNYYEDFTLAALVRRYLGCYMEKSIRTEFSDHSGLMTTEQVEYAAKDVIGTWLIDKEQQKIISPTDKKIWDNLYNPHVWTTLELGGFKLNVECWVGLADKNQEIADRIAEKLGKQYGKTVTKSVGRGKNKTTEEVFAPFNPSSPIQVLEILKLQGLNVESTGDDVISQYADTNEFVKDVLEYRKATKQASTYGMEFLKNVEDDGRIYTSLNISKAETGRDSSSSPNLQNIPRDPERRKCFVAGAGKKLVLYDYSGQEANIWAYITGDELFKEIINGGKKLYIEVARIAFHEEIKKGTERYNIIKSLVLGLMYGLTPWGFAKQENIPVEIATEMFEQFYEGFPQSAAYIKKVQSVNTGHSLSLLGRIIHLHPYDRQWKTNGLNNPMQSSGSDMIKLAMRNLRRTEFYQKYHPQDKVNIVLQVHDEIVTEVAEELAEEWATIQRKVMVDVAESLHPGIKGGVSGGIIDNWSEKE